MMKKHFLLYCFFILSATLYSQTELLPYPTDTIKDTIIYRYYAPKSIGIYRLSKIFDVPQETIIRWNPQLAERGPQLDEILLIPTGKVVEKKAVPALADENDNLVKENENNNLVKANEDKNLVKENKDTVLRLALILPLNAQSQVRDNDDDRFFDFYVGTLLAIQTLQSLGFKIELHVFDVPKNDKSLLNVLNAPWLQSTNAIIGPAYSSQVAIVSQWAKEHKKWLLVPFASKIEDIDSNPYILQFNPSAKAEIETFEDHLAFMSEYERPTNFVIVESAQGTTPYMKEIHKCINNSPLPHSSVQLLQIMVDSADFAFNDSVENILVLHTDKYANAGILMPHIMRLAIQHNLTLFIPYSWLKEKLTLPKIFMTVFSALDEEQIEYQDYQKLFAHFMGKYKPTSTMPRYDLLGYDLTLHLLFTLDALLNGEDLEKVLGDTHYGLQSNIHYQQINNGGWMNKNIKIIKKQ